MYRVYVSEQLTAVAAAEQEAQQVQEPVAPSLWSWQDVNQFIVEVTNVIRARLVMILHSLHTVKH